MDNQENQGQYPGIALPTLSSIVPAFRTQGAEAYKWICANPGIAGKNRAQTLIRRFPPEGVFSRASTATAACTDPLTSRMIRWAWRRVQSEQPVSVSDMASVHHLTLKTLERRFQTYAGGNAVDLLARLKLEYACSLLRETSLPITEIAFRCGYSKQDVLSRALRRSHDCTPREYRKQHSLLTSAI
jgi:AraC-like DNA-binding protein